jgi:hypothetical protein
MNTHALKQTIAEDIETLKQMSKYPIPRRVDSKITRRWMIRLFFLMWSMSFGLSFVNDYWLHGHMPLVGLHYWLLSGVVFGITAFLATVMSFPIVKNVIFFKVHLKKNLKLGVMVWKKMKVFGWISYGVLLGSYLINIHSHGQSAWLGFALDLMALCLMVLILNLMFNHIFGLFLREGFVSAIVKCCSKNKPVSNKKERSPINMVR